MSILRERAKRQAEKAKERADNVLESGDVRIGVDRNEYNKFTRLYTELINKIIYASNESIANMILLSEGANFTSVFPYNASSQLNNLQMTIDSIIAGEVYERLNSAWEEANQQNTLKFNHAIRKISEKKVLSARDRSMKVDQLVRGNVKRNVQLIKNVSEQQLTNIESVIGNAVNMQGGERSITSMIQENLGKINEKSRQRAKFIAKDQLNKNLNALSIAKMESVGIKSYRWNHGNSREPRPWHISLAPNGLNKGVFSLDDPPIIDPKTGERGIPGQLINCSCFPTPVVEA